MDYCEYKQNLINGEEELKEVYDDEDSLRAAIEAAKNRAKKKKQ